MENKLKKEGSSFIIALFGIIVFFPIIFGGINKHHTIREDIKNWFILFILQEGWQE